MTEDDQLLVDFESHPEDYEKVGGEYCKADNRMLITYFRHKASGRYVFLSARDRRYGGRTLGYLPETEREAEAFGFAVAMCPECKAGMFWAPRPMPRHADPPRHRRG